MVKKKSNPRPDNTTSAMPNASFRISHLPQTNRKRHRLTHRRLGPAEDYNGQKYANPLITEVGVGSQT
jgi:hypothetical protein